MDYRNADGTVSEMCGNGVRVFARYLNEREREPNSIAVAAPISAALVNASPAGTKVWPSEVSPVP
ncbi:hypothetical protein NOCA1130001 [metagenome]|uniref:Uncharacterized protein n=1 Tax=metagenome TaxID=256318 RepID=A0A2P2C5U5_9ZZZZ